MDPKSNKNSFSYTDKYSDEKINEKDTALDFENAEGLDDFEDFDDDEDLYGSYDSEEDFSEEDSGDESSDKDFI